MTNVFPGPFQIVDESALSAGTRASPAEYAAWVKQQLDRLTPGDTSILRFRRPRPTAAFSPQDAVHADYEMIKAHARASGFEPIERGTGGRLTMFDEHALGITVLVPHSDPQRHMIERYEVFSGIIVRALKGLGVDARVGELPHEYCPGRFSINSEGRIKLVGIAQRMTRQCVQIGAVVAVERSNKACAAIDEAYRMMGLPFDVATYGALADIRPELPAAQLRAWLVKAISEELCGLS